MAETKIIKLPDGEAFIEVGLDYVRIGAGTETFLVLDKKSMNAGAGSMNWQMSPDQMTYYGMLTHVNPIAGMFPIGPKYMISPGPLLAFANMFAMNALIGGAVGML
jgi:hypothetical protein